MARRAWILAWVCSKSSGDEGLVEGAVGPDPLFGAVPPESGLVAEGDIVDVDEGFVLALLVPGLATGAAGGWCGRRLWTKRCRCGDCPVLIGTRGWWFQAALVVVRRLRESTMSSLLRPRDGVAADR